MNAGTLMVRLAAAFPNPMVDDRTVILYAERLSDAPEQELECAVDWLIDNSKHFPRVAEIRTRLSLEIKAREMDEQKRRLRSDDKQLSEIVERELSQTGFDEVQYPFRTANACKTLVGQTWRLRDLYNEKGVRAYPNPVFYAAQQAMRDLLDERFAESISNRRDYSKTKPLEAPDGKRGGGPRPLF